MTPLAVLAGLVGAAFGYGADRLSARWPAHESGGSRGHDWRTLVLLLGGAATAAALVARWEDPRDLLVLGIYAAALLVLLATDLDQRLLPDVITLPLIPYALALVLLGWQPLLAGSDMPVVVAVGTGLAFPAILLVTDRVFRGALGMGDVKLAVSLGLMCGASRLLVGFLFASVAVSAVLLVLMAVGRLGRRSTIPFGPILIGAGIVAMLVD